MMIYPVKMVVSGDETGSLKISSKLLKVGIQTPMTGLWDSLDQQNSLKHGRVSCCGCMRMYERKALQIDDDHRPLVMLKLI